MLVLSVCRMNLEVEIWLEEEAQELVLENALE